MKLLPVTARVKAPAPAVLEEGLRLDTVGTGLIVIAGLIVKVRAVEVPPPGAGFNTITEAVPAAAISEAGMRAASCAE